MANRAEYLHGLKRTKRIQDHVDTCMAAGQCLIEGCDRPNDEKGGARGLCAMHFGRHARHLLNRRLDEKHQLEMKAIRAGRILAKHEVRAYVKTDDQPQFGVAQDSESE